MNFYLGQLGNYKLGQFTTPVYILNSNNPV
jgi:hypothetical protein